MPDIFILNLYDPAYGISWVYEFWAKISIPTIHHSFASEKRNGSMHFTGLSASGNKYGRVKELGFEVGKEIVMECEKNRLIIVDSQM